MTWQVRCYGRNSLFSLNVSGYTRDDMAGALQYQEKLFPNTYSHTRYQRCLGCDIYVWSLFGLVDFWYLLFICIFWINYNLRYIKYKKEITVRRPLI